MEKIIEFLKGFMLLMTFFIAGICIVVMYLSIFMLLLIGLFTVIVLIIAASGE